MDLSDLAHACMHVRLLHVAQYVQNTAWDILTLKNHLLFI